LGEIAARSNDHELAAHHYAKSLEVARKQGALVFAWETELSVASNALQRKQSGARETIEELLSRFTARGLVGLVARARAALSG
jgi:hypothetical protein